jgi:asparagine synthase (glutamine-hydrolysing)
MCGIAGYWHNDASQFYNHEVVVKSMAQAIVNRGPDDSGIWVDEQSCMALGHQRLSIVDLSPAGHQPMHSKSDRYVMVFNGEIYNHLELRRDLEGMTYLTSTLTKGSRTEWRGRSDTETLLAAFEVWGVEATLKRTVGMFAIALWDRNERVLTLAIDRMGEKPLYYGFQHDTFMFGSELKALKAHPEFLNEIDRDVLCLYLRHCYIPAPYSIYKGIKKLLPGTYLQLPFGPNFANCHLASPKEYWSLNDVAFRGIEKPFVGTDSDAIATLDSQLRQTISSQMIADVPHGAFLSGGIDSSTVVALMQALSTQPVKTFTIGFEDHGFDEAEHARAVAKHLGTNHTELYLTDAEAIQVVPKLGKIYDEPFADSSQIPTFLVSQIARQYVTVSLSGDGGDELFCGYNSYAKAYKWAQIQKIPFGIRKVAGHLVKALAPTTLDSLFLPTSKFIPIPVNLGEKLNNLATHLINVDGIGKLCYNLGSVISDPEQVVIGAKEPTTWFAEGATKISVDDARSQMMLIDTMNYLPNDILVKVDRASMANSLETRIPLLDHRVVELAWSLPMAMKVRDGKNKWILRQVLDKYVPNRLIERPKAGFSVPLGEWLRGPLREWAEELLDKHRLKQEGYFEIDYICEKWREHLTGNRNNQTFLWSVLMFQVWLREQ